MDLHYDGLLTRLNYKVLPEYSDETISWVCDISFQITIIHKTNRKRRNRLQNRNILHDCDILYWIVLTLWILKKSEKESPKITLRDRINRIRQRKEWYRCAGIKSNQYLVCLVEEQTEVRENNPQLLPPISRLEFSQQLSTHLILKRLKC